MRKNQPGFSRIAQVLSMLFILGLSISGCYYDSEEALFPALPGSCDTTDVSYAEDIVPILFEAMEETAVTELNTREKSRIVPVDWAGEYSWILIGGIGLDRGFTVEGLTVSYMPRSTGVGNADNIQQRARFFGYKINFTVIQLTDKNTKTPPFQFQKHHVADRPRYRRSLCHG